MLVNHYMDWEGTKGNKNTKQQQQNLFNRNYTIERSFCFQNPHYLLLRIWTRIKWKKKWLAHTILKLELKKCYSKILLLFLSIFCSIFTLN